MTPWDGKGLSLVMAVQTSEIVRVEMDPPVSPVTVSDPEIQKMLDADWRKQALYLDMYRDIQAVAWVTVQPGGALSPKCEIVMVCPDSLDRKLGGENVDCTVVANEPALIGALLTKGFWDSNAAPRFYAGWQLPQLWATLVTKHVHYLGAATLPPMHRTNLFYGARKAPHVLDISELYSQGVNTAFRKLPSLTDFLKYWDLPMKYNHNELPWIICEEPERAVSTLVEYLGSMYRVLTAYHN